MRTPLDAVTWCYVPQNRQPASQCTVYGLPLNNVHVCDSARGCLRPRDSHLTGQCSPPTRRESHRRVSPFAAVTRACNGGYRAGRSRESSRTGVNGRERRHRFSLPFILRRVVRRSLRSRPRTTFQLPPISYPSDTNRSSCKPRNSRYRDLPLNVHARSATRHRVHAHTHTASPRHLLATRDFFPSRRWRR